MMKHDNLPPLNRPVRQQPPAQKSPRRKYLLVHQQKIAHKQRMLHAL